MSSGYHYHFNEVRYPDDLELEYALVNFRHQRIWYEQQIKHRTRMGVDTAPVEMAWKNFLKLRKAHDGINC